MGEYSALPQRLQLWFVLTIWGHVCQLASMASNLVGNPEDATEATEVNKILHIAVCGKQILSGVM